LKGELQYQEKEGCPGKRRIRRERVEKDVNSKKAVTGKTRTGESWKVTHKKTAWKKSRLSRVVQMGRPLVEAETRVVWRTYSKGKKKS